MKIRHRYPSDRQPRLVKKMLDAILDRYPHFDVVEVYLNTRTPDLPIAKLDALCGGGVQAIIRSPKFQAEWKYKLVLWQPSLEALKLLVEALGNQHRVRLGKVEITLDFIVKSMKIATRLKWAMASMLVIKSWRQQVKWDQGILYHGRRTRVPSTSEIAADATLATTDKLVVGKRERVAPRNYVQYARKGKPGSRWAGKPCFRLEARYCGKAALESIGLTSIQGLIQFDHQAFWATHAKLLVRPSMAEAGVRFSGRGAGLSRTAQTNRGRKWQEQFSIQSHFIMQNAMLKHRDQLRDLDDRWTGPILFGGKT